MYNLTLNRTILFELIVHNQSELIMLLLDIREKMNTGEFISVL